MSDQAATLDLTQVAIDVHDTTVIATCLACSRRRRFDTAWNGQVSLADIVEAMSEHVSKGHR